MACSKQAQPSLTVTFGASNTNSTCFPNVVCSVLAGVNNVSCGSCPSGYQGDSYNCTDINGCLHAACFCDVQCFDVPAPGTGYVCVDHVLMDTLETELFAQKQSKKKARRSCGVCTFG